MQINSDNSLLKQVLKRVSTPFLVLTGNTHGIKPYQKWTHLPTTSVPVMDPSSCPNLRLPFCLQRRLHFFVGAKSEESQLDMSVYGWWQSLLLSELDKQKYLETGEKNRWTVLKKNGVNTAYSKCTCMFTKFISRFLMLCFFSHLHVLHYCCCEPKATNQRNVFWVRCKCHIWFGIIPVSKWLITMVYYG